MTNAIKRQARCTTPVGVKGHIQVRVRYIGGITESHYEANQATSSVIQFTSRAPLYAIGQMAVTLRMVEEVLQAVSSAELMQFDTVNLPV